MYILLSKYVFVENFLEIQTPLVDYTRFILKHQSSITLAYKSNSNSKVVKIKSSDIDRCQLSIALRLEIALRIYLIF